ncbi:SEC10/PgrA surface exclusion domain-containing protein [Lactiplantibacillus carotarum]|uniref:SEC10/PgrA surface exclusion domain-containing protein n=1 Tax=Lactiplantibacillus carotarum TaxID=2993456 RepID=UPI00298F2F6B|nr:SEC10/PgrA surface exclusion domain-containing protein [Lactiplantibacillus carotarum]
MAKQAQATAQSAAQAADQSVAKNQTAATTAQATVNAKQDAVNRDQQQITGQQQATTDATQRQASADAAIQAAQTQAAQTSSAVATKTAEQAPAQTAVANAKDATTAAQGALTSAQTAAQAAQAAVDATQAQLNADATNTADKNTITLAAGINNDLFKNYYAVQAAKDDTATAAAKATVTATLAKTANAANQYHSNAADQAVTVTDLNNLTNAQRTELTQFAANLINQMRTQMGNLPVKITQSAIDFANDVAKRYVADKMSGQGHDVAGIEATAATYGLRSGLGINLYEDLSWGYIWNAQTMNDLKQGIYNTFVDMVANDQGSDFGHADSLTGYNLGTDRDMQQYLGISIDNLGQIHILMVKDSPVYIVDATKFDTTSQIAVNPATTTNVDRAGLTATLAQQNAALTAAKQAVTVKQGQFNTAQGQQAAAQTALDQVNADLARLNQQLVTDQGQLAHLQDQKVTDAATIKTAPAKLAALQAQLASDVQALQAAQPELTNALNTLAAAKTVAAQKHADLDQTNQLTSQL